MTPIRMLCLLATVLAAAGCATTTLSSRNMADVQLSPELEIYRSYRVTGLEVYVPYTLEVSEANAYYPEADIVWREDPPGDRHLQVRNVVRNAALHATSGLRGARDVTLAIEVTRFHSLTEKARYTVGGMHSVHLLMAVYDAQTGALLEGPRPIDASLRAYGGAKAVEATHAGNPPKVRLHRHLAGVLQEALLPPASPPPSGLM